MENVKMPTGAGMWCTMDGETFQLFTKNTWIGDFCALCHITNNDIGLFNITKIYKLVQSSTGHMFTTKKGKLFVNAGQVDSIEWVHILWFVKYLPNAG